MSGVVITARSGLSGDEWLKLIGEQRATLKAEGARRSPHPAKAWWRCRRGAVGTSRLTRVW